MEHKDILIVSAILILITISVFKLSLDILHPSGDVVCWYSTKDKKRKYFTIIRGMFPGEG